MFRVPSHKVFWLVVVLGFVALNLAIQNQIYNASLKLGIVIPIVPGAELLYLLKKLPLPIGFIFFLVSAIPEELFYRLLPLGLCMLSDKFRKYWPIVLVISSVGFGVLHGGLVNMVAQGVSGILLSLQFLIHWVKEKDVIVSSVGVVVTHSLYNTIVLYFLF